MNDADAVGDFLGDAELVRREKHRHAALRTLFQRVLHDARVVRIEAHHRLVDHEHLGVVQQRGRDRDALPRAVREAVDGLAQIRFEIETRDQFLRGLGETRLLHAKHLPREAQHFPRRELVVEERKIRHVGETATRFEGLRLNVETRDARRARGGFHQAREQFDGRGFACGVGAEDGEEFPLGHDEADVVDGREVAEFFNKVEQLDHGWRLKPNS